MNENECRETLRALSADGGLTLSDREAVLCCRHVALVALWNRRVNLTRITGREALVKHVLDSLVPARWLPEGGLALDVGSGAGFPGLPLAVIRPGLRLLLLESDRKKASFLKVAAADLALKNVSVVHGRFEEAPWTSKFCRSPEAHQGAEEPRFDVITMRAVRLDEAMLRKMGWILAPGGVVAYWAGPSSAASAPRHVPLAGDTLLDRLEDSAYELPGLQGRRRLIRWIRRES
ncbi:16S rRNA (guanine(527)-N(7))-methyltransferase RsmG [Desulfosoma sp.]